MNDLFKLRKTWISSAHQGFVEENIHSNTLAAYMLAARKGADMIETGRKNHTRRHTNRKPRRNPSRDTTKISSR